MSTRTDMPEPDRPEPEARGTLEPEALARLAGRLLAAPESAGPDAQIVAGLPTSDQIALFEFLLRGKLPLFRADPANPDGDSLLLFPSLASAPLAERLERERARCDRQRRAFARARATLEDEGVPVLLFKTHGPYPYTSSNVDALVPVGALERATEALERRGHHEMIHYWEPNKRLLRRFDGDELEVMMHLHEKISWIVLGFHDLDALWTNARSSSDPYVLHPAPSHLACALLAHPVYESERISLGDVWKVRSATRAPDFDWDEVLRIARERSWLPGLAIARAAFAHAETLAFGNSRLADPALAASVSATRFGVGRIVESLEGERSLPVRLDRAVRRRLFLRKLLVDNRRPLASKAFDLLGLFHQIAWGRLGLRRRPTSFLAVCGIDGAGKSTHAEALRRAFAECELPTAEVWMRGGHSTTLEGVKRLLRRSARVPAVDDSHGKTAVYRSSWTGSFFAWAVVLEQIVLGLWRVRGPRMLGRFPIAERYVPDTLADLSERLGDPGFPRRAAGRLLRALTPTPDLLVFLDLPGDQAIARKQDAFDAETLEERRARYKDVLALYPEVVVLDATRPEAELRRRIVDLALTRTFARMRRHNPLARQRRDAWE